MLYYDSIAPEALELLILLQKEKLFINTRLVGGTSLALQFGHRRSVDIDLYGTINSNLEEITMVLSSIGEIKPIVVNKAIFTCMLNSIKIDIVNYHYPWIGKMIEEDTLRLADIKDIAAMKLSAITGSGSKKDFID